MQRSAAFSVNVEDNDSRLVAAIRGEVDVSNAAELALRLEGAARQAGDRGLTVDMSDLRYLDSSGLRSLLAVRNGHPNIRLVVRSGTLVARIITVSGLKDVFEVERIPQ